MKCKEIDELINPKTLETEEYTREMNFLHVNRPY